MTRLSIIGVILLALGIALVFAYQAADRETMTAAEFRADSGYQTVTLSHGVTAYIDYGPRDGQPIIIVHGGTLGSMAYQGYVPPLVAAGYRVVIYDQYGRGFSDRPHDALSIDLMRLQLRDLMDALNIQKANLFGVSFGGAIIARFAGAHNARVRALAYQVPVIEGASVSPTLALARMPFIGPMLMRFIALPSIIARGESFGTETDAARRVVAHFTSQFSVQGTQRHMRDLLVGDALSDRMGDHKIIGPTGLRAQFAYAVDDTEIAAAQVEAALGFYDNPDVHQYEGGHFFSSGHMTKLTADLDRFFKSVD